jgi:hypothetical protein
MQTVLNLISSATIDILNNHRGGEEMVTVGFIIKGNYNGKHYVVDLQRRLLYRCEIGMVKVEGRLANKRGVESSC